MNTYPICTIGKVGFGFYFSLATFFSETLLRPQKDRRNIDTDELAEFKKLAALYGRQTDETISTQIKNGDLVEICHAQQT